MAAVTQRGLGLLVREHVEKLKEVNQDARQRVVEQGVVEVLVGQLGVQHGAENKARDVLKWSGVCHLKPLHNFAGGFACELYLEEIKPNEEDDGGDCDGLGHAALQARDVTLFQ